MLDHAAEIGAVEVWILERNHIGIDGAESAVWFVLGACAFMHGHLDGRHAGGHPMVAPEEQASNLALRAGLSP